ncbi:E1B protein large T-antigen [Duck adenovirus 1]|uniref:E1B protein large T-antigen n=1 Tax=Duck adenovirus 1 TaxID=130329 RepID=S5R9V2_DADV1|nr:E1B protein large T-antigen [Duck adenovirus 1]
MAFRPAPPPAPFTAFPYLTGNLPTWSVSTVKNDPSMPLGAYLMLPSENPEDVFNKYQTVYLVPGEQYRWKQVIIKSSITIHGQGALVKLDGPGPSLTISGGSGLPIDMTVELRDINFKGLDIPPDREELMEDAFLRHSAIWSHNVTRTVINGCSFVNFKGAAVWFYDEDTTWSGRIFAEQHLFINNRITGCRIGLALGSVSRNSVASHNIFNDCHVCFNVLGGGWTLVNNCIMNSRCAYLHAKEGMWYSGPATSGPALVNVFSGNVLNNCAANGNMWPTDYLGGGDVPLKLAAFYFNDEDAIPPVWTGNAHNWADVTLTKFSSDLESYSITGCMFIGQTTAVPSAGRIYVGNTISDKVYFFGCSGNGVYLYGTTDANLFPDDFGTAQSGNPPS